MFTCEAAVGTATVPVCVAVSHVAEEPRAHALLAEAWLEKSELVRSERFLVDHARRDFLAGRIAAKSALEALHKTGRAGHAWEIVSGAWSRPKVRGPVGELAVTLAHAAGFGLAVAHDDRWICGADIESLEHPAVDTIATQVTAAEAAWARAGGDEETARWLALWTAREAFGKLLGTGLGLPEALLPTAEWCDRAGGWTARLAGNESFALQTVRGATTVASLALPAGSVDPVTAEALHAWLADALRA